MMEKFWTLLIHYSKFNYFFWNLLKISKSVLPIYLQVGQNQLFYCLMSFRQNVLLIVSVQSRMVAEAIEGPNRPNSRGHSCQNYHFSSYSTLEIEPDMFIQGAICCKRGSMAQWPRFEIEHCICKFGLIIWWASKCLIRAS